MFSIHHKNVLWKKKSHIIKTWNFSIVIVCYPTKCTTHSIHNTPDHTSELCYVKTKMHPILKITSGNSFWCKVAVKSINELDKKKKPYDHRTAKKLMQLFTTMVPNLKYTKKLNVKWVDQKHQNFPLLFPSIMKIVLKSQLRVARIHHKNSQHKHINKV